MKSWLWVLTLLLIVLMCTQWGVRVGGTARPVSRVLPDGTKETLEKREGGVHLTPGDVLLAVTFVAWAVHVVVTSRVCRVRPPFLAVFVFLALMLAAVVRSREWGPGLREVVQAGAYFVGGWLVFANCIDSRRRLRAAVDLFTLAIAAVVVVALVQYRGAGQGNVFRVAGTFGNRNVLGAFLAVVLPFLFGLAMYERRVFQRFALVLAVALGTMVTLSGGALLAVTAGVAFVAARKSYRALLGVVIAAALALTVVPAHLGLPDHSAVVLSSVAPFVDCNYLDRRKGEPEPAEELTVATRYKRWYAAMTLILERGGLFGTGPGTYSRQVADCYGDGAAQKPSGDTDVVEYYNIRCDEPDTFNLYLVTWAESGPLALVALLWIGLLFLGRNLREHAASRDNYGKALALGAAGAVVGAAVVAVFSNLLVRGVAMPFIFVALSGILWPKLPDESRPERVR